MMSMLLIFFLSPRCAVCYERTMWSDCCSRSEGKDSKYRRAQDGTKRPLLLLLLLILPLGSCTARTPPISFTLHSVVFSFFFLLFLIRLLFSKLLLTVVYKI
jgi:hypothetical protein